MGARSGRPPSAAAGGLTTFTVTVPNELADQATVSLDLTIPYGVELDSAQNVPGPPAPEPSGQTPVAPKRRNAAKQRSAR